MMTDTEKTTLERAEKCEACAKKLYEIAEGGVGEHPGTGVAERIHPILVRATIYEVGAAILRALAKDQK